MGYMQKRSSLGASSGSWASVPLSSACRAYMSAAPGCCGAWAMLSATGCAVDCWAGSTAGAARAGGASATVALEAASTACSGGSGRDSLSSEAPRPGLKLSCMMDMNRSGTGVGDCASSIQKTVKGVASQSTTKHGCPERAWRGLLLLVITESMRLLSNQQVCGAIRLSNETCIQERRHGRFAFTPGHACDKFPAFFTNNCIRD